MIAIIAITLLSPFKCSRSYSATLPASSCALQYSYQLSSPSTGNTTPVGARYPRERLDQTCVLEASITAGRRHLELVNYS
jgi:hypothetical protein